jgi:2'-5' RNA ligase
VTTEQPRKLRLFVAIELPPAWLAGLAEAQERMKAAIAQDQALAGVRVHWVRPEGIHLTLKFIGEVETERLDAIRQQIGAVVMKRPGINVLLAGAGSFEDHRAPRVVWVGVQDSPAQSLSKLAGAIDASLAVAGVPRERRGFRLHLTLGRLPDDIPNAQRNRAASLAMAVELPEVAPFTIGRVSLMRSILGPGGARYERLGHWPSDPLQV